MNKLKIYLDTSIISHLQAEDVPEKEAVTLKFWEELKENKYYVIISKLVLDEISLCHEPKLTMLYKYLSAIVFEEIKIDEIIEELGQKYVEEKIIPEKYKDDALHIAAATIAGCDVVLSWNFKHMVKYNTIIGVNGINKYKGYRELEILTPYSFVEEE